MGNLQSNLVSVANLTTVNEVEVRVNVSLCLFLGSTKISDNSIRDYDSGGESITTHAHTITSFPAETSEFVERQSMPETYLTDDISTRFDGTFNLDSS